MSTHARHGGRSWQFINGETHQVFVLSAPGDDEVCHQLWCSCGSTGHIHTAPEDAPVTAFEAEMHIWSMEQNTQPAP